MCAREQRIEWLCRLGPIDESHGESASSYPGEYADKQSRMDQEAITTRG
jgi:hypothetical protein